MRLFAVAAVAVLLLSGVGAARVILVPAIPEQLVEGHTVFATIETVVDASREERFAAAVAILVRERVATESNQKFPGVLWFNDQYLVDPTSSRRVQVRERFPCTGAIIAVNDGDALIVDQDLDGRYTLIDPIYNESYFITDPNEHTWIVDQWNTTTGRPAWTVAIMNNQAGYGTPDNGNCNRSPYPDEMCTKPIENGAPVPSIAQQCVRNLPVAGGMAADQITSRDPRRKSPGDNGMGYPCTGCSPLRYNALLYFRLEHLDVPGQEKNHTEGTGDDWTFDPAACHPTATNSWRCPGGDDDREGNSHPYNPDTVPFPRVGRNNHGGSDSCAGTIMFCHATRNILTFYGYVTPPVVRTFYLVDVAGADAPYHCHADHTVCGTEDVYETARTDPLT